MFILRHFTSLGQLRDAAEDLGMWSFLDGKLKVEELEDWDPEFNRIPMKKITKKGGKRPGMTLKNGAGGRGGGAGCGGGAGRGAGESSNSV